MVSGVNVRGTGATFVIQTVVETLEHLVVVSATAAKRNSMLRNNGNKNHTTVRVQKHRHNNLDLKISVV